ncbi:MAG TPA: helix-turn-helix domain-containing protein [Solirubrobacteraceae bacterium]|nr:helix-turn-helix domain-containing protein [Solirubrobacteraceae bacterium]
MDTQVMKGTELTGLTAGDSASGVQITEDSLPHPAREEMELAVVLHAFSDPMRLRIVAGLAVQDDRTCKSFGLPVTKSTCTHHFRVLREAGVIRQRLEGTTKLNSLRRGDLDARFPGLLASVLGAADHYLP